jgi:nucleoside-diphosphate-sugar epimerase
MSDFEPEFSVLGASGFVGSALVSHLAGKGRRVRAFCRQDPLDYRQPLGHVIFAIGLTADFRTRPFDTIDAHVAQINRLLREADFNSLTYLSSTRVYQGNVSTSEDCPILVSPTNAAELYNLSKLAGESICLACGRPNVRVARLSNIVGLGAAQDAFIDQLLREGLSRGAIALRSHPDSAKDYIPLEDVLHLLELISIGGRETTYNVASGEQTSHRDVLEIIARETGWRVDLDFAAPRIDFPPIDMSRARREFGFVSPSFQAYFPRHVCAFLESAKGRT